MILLATLHTASADAAGRGARFDYSTSSWRSKRATVVNEDSSVRVNCVGKGEPVDNQKQNALLYARSPHPVVVEWVKFVQQGQKGR